MQGGREARSEVVQNRTTSEHYSEPTQQNANMDDVDTTERVNT
jgi:hypothetical protein